MKIWLVEGTCPTLIGMVWRVMECGMLSRDVGKCGVQSRSVMVSVMGNWNHSMDKNWSHSMDKD